MEDRDKRARLEELEEFLIEVGDWADTLEMLGREWAGPRGAALSTYADQMRARIRLIAHRQ